MAFLAKLRPMGPWRASSETGERSRASAVLHSDALYSALTHAMSQMGLLESWIEATAANPQGSAVRFSSCFPFVDQLLFVTPPRTLWPLAASLKVRWKSARYVPTTMVSLLLNNRKVREDDWTVDGPSECLLPVIRGQVVSSPFRPAIRSAAAVDRLGDCVAPYRTACVEFHKGAGIWAAFDFFDDAAKAAWTPALQGALKLLADTGLGGQRSRGWGRFEQPEFVEGRLPQLLFGRHAPAVPADAKAFWLLSQFSPAESDRVDWRQGSYDLALRNGRVESVAGWGAIKKSSKMVVEGSVLVSEVPLTGMAHDVAPEGFAHPVYRAGFALALPLAAAKKVEAVIEESTVAEPESEPLAPPVEPELEPQPEAVDAIPEFTPAIPPELTPIQPVAPEVAPEPEPVEPVEPKPSPEPTPTATDEEAPASEL